MCIYTNVPYTYLIGWTKYNKWYYGVRFSKNCHPNDLWKTYFTSSSYVRDFRKLNGEPDVIEIRKIFDCNEKARIWETKVIQKLNIVESNIWLNRSDNMGKLYNKGYTSEKHKSIVAKNNKNRIVKDETRKKLSHNAKKRHKEIDITGNKNPNFGNKWTEEQKHAQSEKLKGKLKNIKKSEEQKRKMSIARKEYWKKKKEIINGN